MSPIRQKTFKYRGTIIVDTNVINDLFCLVADEHQNPSYYDDRKKWTERVEGRRIKHYLGILEFLGKQGFHIVIPEMVSVEASSVLACGTALLDYAGVPADKRPRFYSPQLAKLLQRAAKNHYMNVVTMESLDTGEPEAKALHTYIKGLEAIKALPSHSKEAQEKLNEMKHSFDRNMGEKAIKTYLKQSKQDRMPNVFVLSQDSEALKDIAKECHVPVINLNGLLRPFIAHGLHKAVGLKEEVTAQSILKECAERRKKISGRQHHVTSRYIDFHAISKSVETKKDVFREAMSELAADLGVTDWKTLIAESRAKMNKPKSRS